MSPDSSSVWLLITQEPKQSLPEVSPLFFPPLLPLVFWMPYNFQGPKFHSCCLPIQLFSRSQLSFQIGNCCHRHIHTNENPPYPLGFNPYSSAHFTPSWNIPWSFPSASSYPTPSLLPISPPAPYPFFTCLTSLQPSRPSAGLIAPPQID